MIKLGSLFSGIGGFELGLERAIPGLETIWQVEQEEFCQKVLQKNWPKAKIYNDVRTINKNNVEPVDIICGGFPCQDISLAGKGEGLNGKRSGLWWEMHRIIGELRPRIAVMENVPALVTRGLPEVLGSLSEIGYDAEWTVISAKDFGAPHLRKRIFIVAYPNQERPGQAHHRGATQIDNKGSKIFIGRSQNEEPSNSNQANSKKQSIDSRSLEKKSGSQCRSGKNSGIEPRNYWTGFPTQSSICHRDDGIPDRLARLRALGNAIVPQCSEWIGEQILNSGLLEDLQNEK
jgi:DNA (cytosine-5)-methyltransferase 1